MQLEVHPYPLLCARCNIILYGITVYFYLCVRHREYAFFSYDLSSPTHQLHFILLTVGGPLSPTLQYRFQSTLPLSWHFSL